MSDILERILLIGILVLVLIGGLSIVIYSSAGMIDLYTFEETGTKTVKCIDERGAEFVDELCTKKTSCSWLGIIGDEKCKDVGR